MAVFNGRPDLLERLWMRPIFKEVNEVRFIRTDQGQNSVVFMLTVVVWIGNKYTTRVFKTNTEKVHREEHLHWLLRFL